MCKEKWTPRTPDSIIVIGEVLKHLQGICCADHALELTKLWMEQHKKLLVEVDMPFWLVESSGEIQRI